MKLPKFITNNIILKITSVNGAVISVRLVIAIFVQRFITVTFGETGHALIGQVRNIIPMLTSTSTLGVFNGIVKYVSEYRNDKPELAKLFSSVALFGFIGVILTSSVLFFNANYFASKLLADVNYNYIIKILALIVPFIAIHRIFNGVINGISDYKSYAKVDLVGYLFGVILLCVGLYYKELSWVLTAIAVTPFLQFLVLIIVFGKVLTKYINFRKIRFGLAYKNQLAAFALMSFVSTVLINYIEIDLRTRLINSINIEQAGYWTAVTNLSKNYMVFSTGIFTLYVLPKFAQIQTKQKFYTEVFHIYKTILPVFAVGMILVFLLKNVIIELLYPGFTEMVPLFKWQLLGDFLRLTAFVLAYQFLAKKLVKSFVITELISIGLFYTLSLWLIQFYEAEGIVMAHFIRNIIYLFVVALFIRHYFRRQKQNTNVKEDL